MKKMILLILLLVNYIEAKPRINVYQDGGLMWLIDSTEKNIPYSMKTKDAYTEEGYGTEGSYENYLMYVNTHKEYKYSNWRIPTKDELITLEQKDTFFARLFASSKQIKTQLSINTEIFYDHKLRHVSNYWTSDTCTTNSVKDGYISIYFTGLRFDQKEVGRNAAFYGIETRCTPKHGKIHFRLVRDVE